MEYIFEWNCYNKYNSIKKTSINDELTMGYYDQEINGFVPYQNKEGTLLEYTEEQIAEIMQRVAQGGRLTTGVDGRPVVVPRPEPTAEEKQAQYELLVDKYIREKYTLSQELAIIRQQATKSEEYQAYFAYCEECKAKAKAEVYGNEV